jgi:hypothetical protein
MSNVPPTQPAWLQQILDGHQRELNASKKNNDTFLQKFDEMVAAFHKDYGVLDQRQSEASQKIQTLQDEVSELKNENHIRQTDIGAVDHRVDEVKEEVFAKIEALRSEFQAKLDGKAAPHPDRPIIPSSSSVGDQCRIEHEFTALLSKAKGMMNCFAMGRVTGVVGFSLVPKTHENILSDYFAGIPVTAVPGLGKSQVKRFVVDKSRLSDFKENLDLYNQQIRADGWWLTVDYPPELRTLRSNAFQFFKEAKSLHDTIRMTYLDVTDNSGYVTVDGIEFVPVYMVPRDKKKWPQLITLLQSVVDSVRSIEWTDRVTSNASIDQAFAREWADIAGVKRQVSEKVIPEDAIMSEVGDGG